jgi:16S rRNA (cytosine1402-N4)-methyltransferase
MNNEQQVYHKPVLMREVLEYLAIKPGGTYVDVTFGGGGHTRAILESDPSIQVVSIDWDTVALEKNTPPLVAQFPDRFSWIWGNFAHLERLLPRVDIQSVDGILADFGTSQFQIGNKEGFSFAVDTPLDMRMSGAHFRVTAADIIASTPEKELARIFFEYGEERFSRQIARAIVAERLVKPIRTTLQLAELVKRVVPSNPSIRIHPATRVFQALRIVVNKELDNIRSFMNGALHVLKPGGRLVCISFHSLEDRLVKQFFQEVERGLLPGYEVEIVTSKVVMAQPDELEVNRSSRSARLRALEVKKNPNFR